MHEVPLVAELVELCVERAEQAPGPVKTVQVRYATTIPEHTLRQAFAMLTEGTPLAGATLVAEPFTTVLDCPACDFDDALCPDDVVAGMAVCPNCSEISSLPGLVELELLDLG